MATYDTITVSAGETFTKHLADDEIWENKLIDITASGAEYFISARSNNWTIRNIGIKGELPSDDAVNAFRMEVPDAASTGLMENVYLEGDELTYNQGGAQRSGIWAVWTHAGDIECRNLYIKNFSDNGFYCSAPGNSSDHPNPGNQGTIRVFDSYSRDNDISNWRLGTDGSYLNNCVAWGGTHRQFMQPYNEVELIDTDLGDENDPTHIQVGSSYDNGYKANTIVTRTSFNESNVKLKNSSTITGSADGLGTHRIPDGVPTDPEMAASGGGHNTDSGGGTTEPEPDPVTADEWGVAQQFTDADTVYWGVDFTPDGERVAFGGSFGATSVHEVGGNWPLVASWDPPDHLRNVSYSPDGALIASALINGEVEIRETSTYSLDVTVPASKHVGDSVYGVAWHPDSTHLLVSDSAGYVYIYDAESWSILATIDNSADGSDIGIMTVAVSPDGAFVAVPSFDGGVVRVYEWGAWGTPLKTFSDLDGAARGVAWHPDSTHLAYCGGAFNTSSPYVRVRETTGWTEVTGSPLTEATNAPTSVAYSADGVHLAYSQVVALDPNDPDDAEGYAYVAEVDADYAPRETLYDADDDTHHVAWHPDGRYLGIAARDNSTYVHNAPIDMSGLSTIHVTATADGALTDRVTVAGGGELAMDARSLPSVDGPDVWELRFDTETIRVDAIEPATMQTWTPGTTVSIRAGFSDLTPELPPYRERYEALRKYQHTIADAVTERGLTDKKTPWYRERVPADAPIDSFLVRIRPSAGVPNEFAGAWALITGVTDASHHVADWRVVELDLHVLGDGDAYRDHAHVREQLEAPIVPDTSN